MRFRARYLGLVAAVIIAMLAPGTARAAGYQVSGYDGLSPSQRASLLSIARDTWKFYGADVDQATSLPMDNITFAGGSATPPARAGTPPPPTSGCTCGRSSRPGTSA